MRNKSVFIVILLMVDYKSNFIQILVIARTVCVFVINTPSRNNHMALYDYFTHVISTDSARYWPFDYRIFQTKTKIVN